MSRRLFYSKDGTSFKAGTAAASFTVPSQAFLDAMDDTNEYQSATGYADWKANIDQRQYLIWHFPNYVSLEKAVLGFYNKGGWSYDTCAWQVSYNTTNGIDGSWTTVNSNSPTFHVTKQHVTQVFSAQPATRWLRLYCWGDFSSQGWHETYCGYLHLYGTYDNESFELYDNETTPALITDWTDFLSADGIAYDDVDLNLNRQFKIKNTDTVSHTYTIDCSGGLYPFSDSLVDTYYRISKDGGATPVTNLTTASVAPDAFSEVIDVDFTLTAANNPTDGIHYFRVTIEENV